MVSGYWLSDRIRCKWVSLNDPLYLRYHDTEWGVPQHDDRILFEFLVLEGAQAGLSWKTILSKRENYRIAFDYFDPQKVSAYSDAKFSELMSNSGIVRNRLKIRAAISNAGAFLKIQEEYGSFDAFIWSFIGGRPLNNARENVADIPATTRESDAMSKALLKEGFRFVGSTICYSFMQAVGMVNDHTVDCFRHEQIGRMTS